MRTKSPIVVALGGNAISRPDEEGNIPQQFANTRRTAILLANLIEAGCQTIVTHGNGPQVGNVMRRVELAAKEVYRLPIDICGAHTQGGMGYMIAQCLMNELRGRGVDRRVTAIVTSVEVDPDDPDFQNPTKPVGGHYRAERAAELQREFGWKMVQVPKRGWRRVVPSPAPRAIVEIDLIRRLAQQGELLVVAGGGGIPVRRTPTGALEGIEAVIDKDRTSGLLAREIGAATFIIGTNIERVVINYHRPDEYPLERVPLSEIRWFYEQGQFPPGSMGPKIEAAIDFLAGSERADACVIICDVEKMADALDGRSGTWLVKD